MTRNHGAHITGRIAAGAIGLVVAACTLPMLAGTTLRPHPEPQQAAVPVLTALHAPARIHG